MKGKPNPYNITQAIQNPDDHQPSANTAAVVTLAADSEQCHVITSITFGYNATPTSGSVVVTAGGTTIFSVPVAAAGAGQIHFPYGLHNDAALNEAVVVTLAAAGASVTGRINTTSC